MNYGNQTKSYSELQLKAMLNSFKSFGYEAITVNGSVKALTIPTGAKYALLSLESDGTGVVARCLQNTGTVVSTTVGMGIRDGFVGDITDAQNLTGFRITETASNTTVLHVEYFK